MPRNYTRQPNRYPSRPRTPTWDDVEAAYQRGRYPRRPRSQRRW